MDVSSLTPKRMRKGKNGKQGTRYYDSSNQLVAKTCATCDEVKPVSAFAEARTQTDGLFSKCYPCAQAYQKKYRETGPVNPNTVGRAQYINRTDEEIRSILEEKYPDRVKECPGCHEKKSLDEYYINKSNPSIVSSKCKECVKGESSSRIKTLVADNPDYYAEHYRKYKEQWENRTEDELHTARTEAFPDGVRTCTRCGITRPLDRFSITPSVKNATATECHECKNKRRNDRHKELRRTVTPEEAYIRHKEHHPSGTKICRKCRKFKPIDGFRKDYTRLDCLRRICAECSNQSRAELRKKEYESHWRSHNIPFECYICQGPYEHSDHVIPTKLGGSDDPPNRLPICAYHNGSKNGTLLEDWLATKHHDIMADVLDKVVNVYNVEISPFRK